MQRRSLLAGAWRVGIIFSLALSLWAPGWTEAEEGQVLSTEGKVQLARPKAEWTAAATGQKLESQDRLRTLALSRAMVQLAELGRVRLDELTTLEILPPRNAQSKGTLDLKAGAIYFFTREKPREFEIQTPQALAASRGTEFLVSIEPSGRELFTVYDGEVELANALGAVLLNRGEQGIVETGRPPRKTAVIESSRIVQWWLYYPAVLDPAEPGLDATQQAALGPALNDYRQGALLDALAAYPDGRVPQSDAERDFHAALLLSVGQVAEAETLLSGTNSATVALRLMAKTVEMRDVNPLTQPQTGTEWLVNSYVLQSQFDLKGALAAARKAVEVSPNFGFGWTRVAELEFSFGHTAEALGALDWAFSFSPRNAQAWVLKGFLACEQLQWQSARDDFEKAISLDPALGNGWLGRGLVRIRLGDGPGGRGDLQTAAAMEPNRSLLRSYLGKGFDYTHNTANANRELALAKQLDAGDPTPWLYSALVLRQENRYNQAVTALEKSAALNDDRRVYRSRLLLDEDQAVRSASLATIYRPAGMDEVSMREAAKSVDYDYANHSAHQFLAESFDGLRDPTRFSLRYATPWFNELLLANLLAPVAGGNLSQNISAQEYSRLFVSDNLGFGSVTDYRSDGQIRQIASQYGTEGRFSYALDLDYQHNDGIRPNNQLDRIEWFTTAKYQITPRDSVLVLFKFQDYDSGDNFQYYNPSAKITNATYAVYGLTGSPVIQTNFSYTESERPVVVGYHHEWSPGSHTLFLGGWLENDQRLNNDNVFLPILTKSSTGQVTNSQLAPFNVNIHNYFSIFTSELNQILQSDRQILVVGARYQNGTFRYDNLVNLAPAAAFLQPFFNSPPAQLNTSSEFEHISGYGYYTLEVIPNLRLTGGAAYDQFTYPLNFRQPPLSPGSTSTSQLSPKAALVWSPTSVVTVRGMYAQSLGGVSLDDSYRLEPIQLAGFNQMYRNLFPESVGSISVPSYETAGAALDLKFKTRTYAGVQGQLLKSSVSRQFGVFDFGNFLPPPPSMTVSSITENLDYKEPSVAVTVNQLAGDYWSFGAQYRFTHSQLHTRLPAVPVSIEPTADSTLKADLQQSRLFVLFNHPTGFFSRIEALWYHQENAGYTPALPGDDFWQENIFFGYRLPRQYAELTLGVMNLSGVNYHLNPLNYYTELPRSRVFTVRFQMNF